MYPSLDEAIEAGLKNSSEPVLKKYHISLPDPNRRLQAFTNFILIGHSEDDFNEDESGFDFEEREETYDIIVGTKKLDYLQARAELREVVAAIKRTLRSCDELIDYAELMSIKSVQTEYGDNFVIKQQWIKVSFKVEEEYLDTEKVYKDVNYNVEVEYDV